MTLEEYIRANGGYQYDDGERLTDLWLHPMMREGGLREISGAYGSEEARNQAADHWRRSYETSNSRDQQGRNAWGRRGTSFGDNGSAWGDLNNEGRFVQRDDREIFRTGADRSGTIRPGGLTEQALQRAGIDIDSLFGYDEENGHFMDARVRRALDQVQTADNASQEDILDSGSFLGSLAMLPFGAAMAAASAGSGMAGAAGAFDAAGIGTGIDAGIMMSDAGLGALNGIQTMSSGALNLPGVGPMNIDQMIQRAATGAFGSGSGGGNPLQGAVTSSLSGGLNRMVNNVLPSTGVGPIDSLIQGAAGTGTSALIRGLISGFTGQGGQPQQRAASPAPAGTGGVAARQAPPGSGGNPDEILARERAAGFTGGDLPRPGSDGFSGESSLYDPPGRTALPQESNLYDPPTTTATLPRESNLYSPTSSAAGSGQSAQDFFNQWFGNRGNTVNRSAGITGDGRGQALGTAGGSSGVSSLTDSPIASTMMTEDESEPFEAWGTNLRSTGLSMGDDDLWGSMFEDFDFGGDFNLGDLGDMGFDAMSDDEMFDLFGGVEGTGNVNEIQQWAREQGLETFLNEDGTMNWERFDEADPFGMGSTDGAPAVPIEGFDWSRITQLLGSQGATQLLMRSLGMGEGGRGGSAAGTANGSPANMMRLLSQMNGNNQAQTMSQMAQLMGGMNRDWLDMSGQQNQAVMDLLNQWHTGDQEDADAGRAMMERMFGEQSQNFNDMFTGQSANYDRFLQNMGQTIQGNNDQWSQLFQQATQGQNAMQERMLNGIQQGNSEWLRAYEDTAERDDLEDAQTRQLMSDNFQNYTDNLSNLYTRQGDAFQGIMDSVTGMGRGFADSLGGLGRGFADGLSQLARSNLLGNLIPGLLESRNQNAYGDKMLAGMREAAEMSDPFRAQRPFYQDQLRQMHTDPNFLKNSPVFQNIMNPAMDQVQAKMAAQGYNNSGNMMQELTKTGVNTAANYFQNQQQLTGQFAGGYVNPANAGNIFGQGVAANAQSDKNSQAGLGYAFDGILSSLFGPSSRTQTQNAANNFLNSFGSPSGTGGQAQTPNVVNGGSGGGPNLLSWLLS